MELNLQSIVDTVLKSCEGELKKLGFSDVYEAFCDDAGKLMADQETGLSDSIDKDNEKLKELDENSKSSTKTKKAKKEALEARIEEKDNKLQKIREGNEKRLRDMKEQIKKQIEQAIEDAQVYADEIVMYSGNLGEAITNLSIQTGALITQISGAISAAIMNPGSTAFTTPAILLATQSVKKAKSDALMAAKQMTSAVLNLNKAIGVIYVLPVAGEVLKSTLGSTLDGIKNTATGFIETLETIPI